MFRQKHFCIAVFFLSCILQCMVHFCVRCAAAVTRNEVTVSEAAAVDWVLGLEQGSAKGLSRGAPSRLGQGTGY